MMEKQCDAATQQKLAEYARQGGTLILVGRVCAETFDHVPCTILQDAIGIQGIQADPPFTPVEIHAFAHRDIPASFVETYVGDFDEVFATSAEGQTVGFIKQVGKGRVMVFGAALAANTLDDLDILHHMANRVGCPPLFTLSDWADVRLSEGENGGFLFVNNYQDDPLETTITCAGVPLLGGHALALPARCGAILPLGWRVRPGVMVHYATSEIVEVRDEGSRLVLKTAQPDFWAEVSLSGYAPDAALIAERVDDQRFSLHGRAGVIELTAD
jgi:beta-galactosidase